MPKKNDDPKKLLTTYIGDLTKDELAEAHAIMANRRGTQFIDSWGVWIVVILVTLLAVKLLGAFAHGWSGAIPLLGITWAQLAVIVLGIALAGYLYIRRASQLLRRD